MVLFKNYFSKKLYYLNIFVYIANFFFYLSLITNQLILRLYISEFLPQFYYIVYYNTFKSVYY